MANLEQTNTLNDTRYSDNDVAQAKLSETTRPAGVGPEYDTIHKFFLKVMKDPLAAGNFTMSLYEVAAMTNTKVLALFDTVKDKDQIEVNAIMAYYMNALRSNATLIGVQNVIRPNYYAGRNVLS